MLRDATVRSVRRSVTLSSAAVTCGDGVTGPFSALLQIEGQQVTAVPLERIVHLGA